MVQFNLSTDLTPAFIHLLSCSSYLLIQDEELDEVHCQYDRICKERIKSVQIWFPPLEPLISNLYFEMMRERSILCGPQTIDQSLTMGQKPTFSTFLSLP